MWLLVFELTHERKVVGREVDVGQGSVFDHSSVSGQRKNALQSQTRRFLEVDVVETAAEGRHVVGVLRVAETRSSSAVLTQALFPERTREYQLQHVMITVTVERFKSQQKQGAYPRTSRRGWNSRDLSSATRARR